jgi:hypothetical protein
MKTMKIKYLLAVIAILTLVNSCKTSKNADQIALTKMSVSERIDMLRYQAVPYNTLSSSLRFSLKTGNKAKNTSVDAQLKIKKDEIIQLSLRIPLLGSEAAKISITPEKIIFIDRLNKQYFAESMETIQELSPFDFDYYSLQALFTNHLFIAGKQTITEDDYASFKLNEDAYSITVSNTDSKKINYDFVSDFTSRILKTEMYKDKQQIDLNWFYKDFGLTSDKKLFPMKMNLELTIPGDLITMNLAFSTVDINSEFSLDVSIPAKYRQITLDQLTKLIQSL